MKNCNWEYSIPIYYLQSVLYLIYLILLLHRWINLQPHRHHRRLTAWKVLYQIFGLIFWTIVGYGIDIVFTSMLDSVVVGWDCAIQHSTQVLGSITQIMLIILYMGWKIVLALMLWERHPSMLEALGFMIRDEVR